jgi:hypothetical protein
LELGDYLLPYTIRGICLLGVADQLTDGPLPIAELARRGQTHQETLRKAVEYLATREIFTISPEGIVDLTPMAELLRHNHPYSVRDIFLSPVACTRAMEGLDHAIRTGEPAFDAVHGVSMWKYLADNPQDGAAFDGVMSGVTGLELRAILRANDWSRFATIVDVGGGNGALLASLLRRVKTARGILFDLPGVVANAPACLAQAGVGGRVRVVPGSFLSDPIPPGGDAYVLKRILYSWSDDEAVGILRRVRAAMPSGGHLYLMEAGRQAGEDPVLARRMAMLMHTLTAGGARSLAQQENLLQRAGLRLTRCLSTPMFPIIEAVAP